MYKSTNNLAITELKFNDIEAALAILNPAFALDPTLSWFLSANTNGFNERRHNYLKSYLTFHHVSGMPALGAWVQGKLVGVSYFTPASHCVEASNYTELGRSIRECCGDESLARINLLLATMEAELPAEDMARIEFIAISPENQGSGLGGKLLTATLDHLARANNTTKVCLETGEKLNLSFYSRHGFTLHKSVELTGLTQNLMRLELTNIPNPSFNSDVRL